MVMNYVGAWCLMQYMDAEKLKEPIGFLDPTRICQTQHTVRLQDNSDQLKDKTLEEILEHKKNLHKTKLLSMAQYIGRAFLQFQNKSTATILDPLDYRHNSTNSIYVYVILKCHKQPRGTILCGITNASSFDKIKLTFDDTGITNVQQDPCRFIHHKCCHEKGHFFDPEGSLAINDDYKSLQDWVPQII
uniref:Uncharacterized protein n=1 Tax=Oryza punctata TaxID=4537 RepID=A0A0E0MML0_ORYPU